MNVKISSEIAKTPLSSCLSLIEIKFAPQVTMNPTFESIPLSVLAQFFQPCTGIPLDCDGIAQLITTILTLSEIPHQGYVGQVQCPNFDVIMPHCWIELCSDQGTLFRVDYSLKDWVATDLIPTVPISFFHPCDYPAYCYLGKSVQHYLWAAELFDFIQVGLDPNTPRLTYRDLRSLRSESEIQ